MSPAGRKIRSAPFPYPRNRVVKAIFASPLMLYRLGLGRVAGRVFMVLTTTGRRTGLPRHTVLEFHEYHGRRYVYSAFGESADWYRNVLADPHVTIQTAAGIESTIARRVSNDQELLEAFGYIESSPAMRAWTRVLGVNLDRESFIAGKEGFCLVTFDPTTESAPPPLKADLKWLWPIMVACLAIVSMLILLLLS